MTHTHANTTPSPTVDAHRVGRRNTIASQLLGLLQHVGRADGEGCLELDMSRDVAYVQINAGLAQALQTVLDEVADGALRLELRGGDKPIRLDLAPVDREDV